MPLAFLQHSPPLAYIILMQSAAAQQHACVQGSWFTGVLLCRAQAHGHADHMKRPPTVDFFWGRTTISVGTARFDRRKGSRAASAMSSGRIMFSGGTPALQHHQRSHSGSAHGQCLLHECHSTFQTACRCHKCCTIARRAVQTRHTHEVRCITPKNATHCLKRTYALRCTII